MIPDNILKLINALIEKTNANQAIWGRASRENEFKLVFDNGAVTTDQWNLDGNDLVDFAIYNSFGDKVDSYIANPVSDLSAYKKILELHNIAKRKFFKVDDTIIGLFEELNSNKSIGNRTDEKLPF